MTTLLIYELALADVYVGAGVVALSQAQITDQRLNSALCGLVVGTVGELDTTAFSAQLQAWFEEYRKQSADTYDGFVDFVDGLKTSSNGAYAAFGQWLADFKTQANTEFQTWSSTIQDILDENAATNLYKIRLL